MKKSHDNSAVSPARASFFWASLATQSLTRATLAWLLFRASINTSGWQQRVREHHLKADNPHALNQWLALQPVPPFIHFLLLPSIVAVVLGAVSMIGALSYSGAKPVNVWLMFALFCWVPFLLGLISFAAAFNLRRSGRSFIQTLLIRWLQRLAKGNVALSFLNSLAFRAWLLLQAQILGLLLQLSLMGTFLIILLFNDVAFGWASTIIQSTDALHTLFHYVTLPWQWFLAAPSAELIQQSQYFYSDSIAIDGAEVMRTWWPHIFLAMALYGLAPRVALVIFLQWRCRQLLYKEVCESAELEQFFNVLHFTASVEAKSLPDTRNTTYSVTEQLHLKNTDAIVFWQRPSLMADIFTLGVKTWRDDKAWLEQQANIWVNHLWVVVQEHQTPTAELTDTLQLIKRLNAHLNIHLSVVIATASQHSQSLSLALSTWQFFAAEQKLSLHSALCIYRDELLIVEAN